jgi:hypothetical protein
MKEINSFPFYKRLITLFRCLSANFGSVQKKEVLKSLLSIGRRVTYIDAEITCN